jgi:hypothetical protein
MHKAKREKKRDGFNLLVDAKTIAVHNTKSKLQAHTK